MSVACGGDCTNDSPVQVIPLSQRTQIRNGAKGFDRDFSSENKLPEDEGICVNV